MRCDDFIENYSDFRDGIVSDERRAEFESHVSECATCRRYDLAVEKGVTLCAEIHSTSPSPDFMPRLQHRIFHVDDAARLTTKRALGSAALIAVAGVGFLAVTWLPFATRVSVEVQLPPVAVEAPVTSSNIFGSGPHLLQDGAFLLPFNPTLDESTDLFTTYSRSVEDGWWMERQAIPTGGQLDSSR